MRNNGLRAPWVRAFVGSGKESDARCVAPAAEIVARIVSGLPINRVGVLWDSSHTYRAGEPIQESIELIGDRIRHVHVKDNLRSPDGEVHYCSSGAGEFPVRRMAEALTRIGFDGFLSLEWERA